MGVFRWSKAISVTGMVKLMMMNEVNWMESFFRAFRKLSILIDRDTQMADVPAPLYLY